MPRRARPRRRKPTTSTAILLLGSLLFCMLGLPFVSLIRRIGLDLQDTSSNVRIHAARERHISFSGLYSTVNLSNLCTISSPLSLNYPSLPPSFAFTNHPPFFFVCLSIFNSSTDFWTFRLLDVITVIMASRIPAAWRVRAGKSTNTGGLNFHHVTKSTLALARWTPTSPSASASSRSTTTSTPAIAAWPPRLRLGSSGTVLPARSLFQRQQHQQRRSFGGFNFLLILMCYPPPPGLCCIS